MRLIVVFAIAAAVSAGCGGDRPPAVPGGSSASATPAEPARGLPAPPEGDLHGAPRPDDEDLRELYDISRDLHAVAANEGGAVADLSEDLGRFVRPNSASPDVKALADAVGRALQGRTLDEAGARRLAVLLYVTMHAADITPAQRTAAATQWREALAATGAPAAAGDAVASQVR